MEEARRGLNQLIKLIALILGGGTLGYYFIEEGWSLMDAFYMTVITITTIGYGEVHELSSQGRAFTVLLIVVGLGASATLASHFARMLLENTLKGVWGKRNMEKLVEKLSGHFIICGYGQIGRAISADLHEQGIPFVVIDADVQQAELARQRQYPVLNGNATTDLMLLSAGITRAAGLVAALPSDADNLYVTLTARELNAKLYIVVRSEGEGVEHRMHRAGADIVVSPMKLGGRQIAQMIADLAGTGEKGSGVEALSSVLGFQLKVYTNLTTHRMTVEEVLRETGALRALAKRTVKGDLLKEPSVGESLEPDETLVLVLHEEPGGGDKDRSAPSAIAEEMDWDSGLSVGIMEIDEEHQILLGLIHKLKLASMANEREVISSVLNDLIDYTVKHFRHEESILRKHGYPELEEHLREHHDLKEKVVNLQRERQFLVKENFSTLLNQWLRHHIMGTDKRYSAFLNEKGVK